MRGIKRDRETTEEAKEEGAAKGTKQQIGTFLKRPHPIAKSYGKWLSRIHAIILIMKYDLLNTYCGFIDLAYLSWTVLQGETYSWAGFPN